MMAITEYAPVVYVERFSIWDIEVCLSRIFVDRSDLSKAKAVLKDFHAYRERFLHENI